MHTTIGAVLVVDLDDENVFVYVNDPRDPMKSYDGSYYGFEKDVDEAFDCTSAETEADTFKQYIGAYLEADTRRAGSEELDVILPPWSTGGERVGSRRMWF